MKKRRYLTNTQKTVRERAILAACRRPVSACWRNIFFEKPPLQGQDDGVLIAEHTADGMRSYMRSYRKDLQQLAEEQKRCENSSGKRDAKRLEKMKADAGRTARTAAEPSEKPLRLEAPAQEKVKALFDSCVGRTHSWTLLQILPTCHLQLMWKIDRSRLFWSHLFQCFNFSHPNKTAMHICHKCTRNTMSTQRHVRQLVPVLVRKQLQFDTSSARKHIQRTSCARDGSRFLQFFWCSFVTKFDVS